MNLLINTPLVYTINDTTTTKIYTLSLHDALPISLPLLNVANNLGNQLPVAVADTTTFPGSDYYEISLVEYRAQLHSDLPPVSGTWPNQTGGTQLRGYMQTNGGLGVPNYLGPIIIAQSNRPVRVKFTNA